MRAFMSIEGSRPPDNVVPFRPLRPNAFTMQDRIQALDWQSSVRPPALARARLDIHREQPGDGQEVCDLMLLYCQPERWARWGAARRGDRISVWRCADGIDLGRFETMNQALAALAMAEDQARPRARRARRLPHAEARSA